LERLKYVYIYIYIIYIYIYIYIHIYIYTCICIIYIIQDDFNIFCHPLWAEWIELSRKVLYHFAIFAIVNKILITKHCQILILNNFLLKYYQLYRKAARDKNHLFSSHKVLRIFSEFFQNFLIPYFLMLVKIRKNWFLSLAVYKVNSIWIKKYSRPIFGNFSIHSTCSWWVTKYIKIILYTCI